ncbi:D-lyxose/D-mannose family sugar isomerase [candidate division KSB3 bacterium]|uniref:D-lyxose/D-mannose family sugar isomerase n=1 Tax=candidate division KSB3 bacterium TaxID=2044937 RepID=A0A9D5JYI5_9BACT|nr:D-lyxose/D-mannose family sugar isomerase [candidate division KSB3 bacterium]MBD3326152.1 D-lyxose/D-mannose family sugar isomerase [candidate division KSB3 bacterium]
MMRPTNLITDEDQQRIQVADFGLSQLETEGAQILPLVDTDRLAVKIIALFPHQTLPEHWHPPVGDDPGKEETFRVISGTLLLYVEGTPTLHAGSIPAGKDACYTARHEIVMQPRDQITLAPGAKHWLQAGSEGAVVFSFSTCARDILDGFSDPDVVRTTKIVDD